MWASWQAAAVSLALAAPAEIALVGDGGIFASHADGSGRTLLVAPGKGESLGNPAWSPDGTTLAYVTGGEDDSRIVLRDAAGATREFTPKRANVSDSGLTWSPDGTRLAFSRWTADPKADTITTEILIREVASGAERAVVTQKMDARLTSVFNPAWSPDGATIAYTLYRYDRHADGAPQIRTVPAAGGASKLLISRAQLPAYAPDGRIAYASVRDRNGRRCGSDECSFAGELYVANGDGSHAKRLTRDEGEVGTIAWAPDSSRLLFDSDRALPEGDSTEVYSVAPDGSCLTWITNSTPGSGSPSFRPGSGDSFAPPNCDPNTRAATRVTPSIKRYVGNLWAGPTFRSLVLSRAEKQYLYYSDCERFNGCPTSFSLSTRSPCGRFPITADRLVVRRGLLLGFQEFESRPYVFGGRRATLIDTHGNVTLAQALKTFAGLKVIRRETPRIPRTLVNRLDAKQQAKLRPYRVCGRA